MTRRWKILLTMLITIVIASATTLSATDIATQEFPPQALVVVESNYAFTEFTFTPKLVLFAGSDFLQPWMYGSFKRGKVTGSIGMIMDYRELSGVGFAALKISLTPMPILKTNHEFHVINHDNDFLYVGLIHRKFKTHNSFIGLYWELMNTDVTRLQVSPQVGIGNFELNVLFGKHESNIRATWIVKI